MPGMLRLTLLVLLAIGASSEKILYLHGGAGNAQEVDVATAALQASFPEFEFVGVNGPVCNAGEQCYWVLDPPEGNTPDHVAAASVAVLDHIVAEQGPFYGIMGFSQGAMFVTAYLAHAPVGTFEIAMMFCGYLPLEHLDLLDKLNAASPFGDIPALVWISARDTVVAASYSEQQAALFTSPTIITSPSGGHAIPNGFDSTYREVVAFITSNLPNGTGGSGAKEGEAPAPGSGTEQNMVTSGAIDICLSALRSECGYDFAVAMPTEPACSTRCSAASASAACHSVFQNEPPELSGLSGMVASLAAECPSEECASSFAAGCGFDLYDLATMAGADSALLCSNGCARSIVGCGFAGRGSTGKGFGTDIPNAIAVQCRASMGLTAQGECIRLMSGPCAPVPGTGGACSEACAAGVARAPQCREQMEVRCNHDACMNKLKVDCGIDSRSRSLGKDPAVLCTDVCSAALGGAECTAWFGQPDYQTFFGGMDFREEVATTCLVARAREEHGDCISDLESNCGGFSKCTPACVGTVAGVACQALMVDQPEMRPTLEQTLSGCTDAALSISPLDPCLGELFPRCGVDVTSDDTDSDLLCSDSCQALLSSEKCAAFVAQSAAGPRLSEASSRCAAQQEAPAATALTDASDRSRYGDPAGDDRAAAAALSAAPVALLAALASALSSL